MAMAALGGGVFGDAVEAAGGDGKQEAEEDGDGDEAGRGQLQKGGQGGGGDFGSGGQRVEARANFRQWRGLGGVGEGLTGGAGFGEFLLQPEQANGELHDVFVELIFWGGCVFGLSEAGFDEAGEKGGGDSLMRGAGEEEAGAPGLANGVNQDGGASGREGTLSDEVERSRGGQFFIPRQEKDDNGDVRFFSVVAQEAPEVFGLGFGELGAGVNEGIVARPSLCGGEELGGGILQVDDGCGAEMI